jgi:hypothetical protein
MPRFCRRPVLERLFAINVLRGIGKRDEKFFYTIGHYNKVPSFDNKEECIWKKSVKAKSILH